MRVIKVGKAPADDGIRREAGVTMLLPVEPAWLVQAMAKAADWFKPAGKDKDPLPVDPPEKYARALLALPGDGNS